MESYQDKTGGRWLANPNNDNISSGPIFSDLKFIEEHQTSASSYSLLHSASALTLVDL